MEPLKTAVIGVGYLGRFHAQKFSKLEDSNLLGVVDNDLKRAEAVSYTHLTLPTNACV